MTARPLDEECLAAIGRLTCGIAHDFNILLTVIQGVGGLLVRQESVAEDAAVLLVQQAREATRMCASITSQLPSFSHRQNLRPA